MLADIKGPHLDFLGGRQQPFTPLWVCRYQPNQAESCKGNSAMEIRATNASAKFRQSNRTDKWIELTMELLHSCLTPRVGTWSTALWHNTRKKHTSHKSNPPMPNFIIIHNVCTWNANCSLWIRNVMYKDFATTVRRHRYTNTYQRQYLTRILDRWKKAYSAAIYWPPETSVLDNIHNFFLVQFKLLVLSIGVARGGKGAMHPQKFY